MHLSLWKHSCRFELGWEWVRLLAWLEELRLFELVESSRCADFEEFTKFEWFNISALVVFKFSSSLGTASIEVDVFNWLASLTINDLVKFTLPVAGITTVCAAFTWFVLYWRDESIIRLLLSCILEEFEIGLSKDIEVLGLAKFNTEWGALQALALEW